MSSLRRFLSYKQNWLALFIVGFFFAVAIAAPWLAPPEPDAEDPAYREIDTTFYQLPEPPRPDSKLGTVPKPPLVLPGIPVGQGRAYQWDIYHTLVWGTRSALRFGLTVVAFTAIAGVFIGSVSGYLGGRLEGILMRVTDAFLAFPVIAAIWVLERALFSELNIPSWYMPLEPTAFQRFLIDFRIDSILVALIIFGWMPYARITNTVVSQLMEQEFIVAARSIGATGPRIVIKHLLPNALSPSIVMAARDIGAVVILATAFIFIGLGGGGHLSWGVVLVGGRDFVIGIGGNPFHYWWVFVPIALALILFGLGWNLLGDGLNKALNPKSARRFSRARGSATQKRSGPNKPIVQPAHGLDVVNVDAVPGP